MIGATDRGLCFLQFGDTRRGLLTMLEKEYPAERLVAMSKPYHPDFQKWTEALNDYLAGTHSHLDLPPRHSSHGLPDSSLELPPVHSLR